MKGRQLSNITARFVPSDFKLQFISQFCTAPKAPLMRGLAKISDFRLGERKMMDFDPSPAKIKDFCHLP